MATEMKTQKQIGIYLVDVSGSMKGDRLENCKKFVTSMRETADRFTIYTYGSKPKEVSYDQFMKMPADGGTKIEITVNEMLTTHLLKEKANFVDFVLLTDAEDDITDLDTLKANVATAQKQFSDCGTKLDISSVFVLKNGKWNDTAKKIKKAFGAGDVYDNAALDKKLKETKAGIKECNHARKVYMKCKSEMDAMKKALQSSTPAADDAKDESKQENKETIVLEKVEKAGKETDDDMKTLENEVKDLLSADFLKDIDEQKLENIDNEPEMKKTETETETKEAKTESEIKNDKNEKNDKNDKNDKKDEKAALSTDDLDNLLSEIDSDEQRQKLKKEWIIGSKVEIFIRSTQTWVKGEITKIFTDKDGEWLVVQYGSKNVKEITRYSVHIRPINKADIENHVNAEEKKMNESIRNQVQEDNPFDINDNKTETEIAQEKSKEKLDTINNKLQQICNGMDMNISELKSLLVNEKAKTTVAEFENLESLLNNITIKSVQSKVESMKQDLIDAKNEILAVLNELEKKAAEQTNVNQQIKNIEKNKTHILKIQHKMKKEIDKCVAVMEQELKKRKDKYDEDLKEKIIDAIIEQQLVFMAGDMRGSKKTIVKNVLKDCMKSKCMKVSQIRDKLKENYMKVVVILADYGDTNIPDYDVDSCEYGRWNCGVFGIYDIVNMKENIVLTEAEGKAICNVDEMEEKCDKYIREISKSAENTRRNAKETENMIEDQRNKIIDIVNQRMDTLQKQLKEAEIKKLEMYNYNLNKIQEMESQVKEVQIEFNSILRNESMPEQSRKPKITSQSQILCDKANIVFKNEIAHSVNDTLNLNLELNEISKFIGNAGIVNANEIVPELKVAWVQNTQAQIDIEYKSEDKVLLYTVQYKQIEDKKNYGDNYENVFVDDDDENKENKEKEEKTEKEEKEEKEEKKENVVALVTYTMEFEPEQKNEKTLIKNLKKDSKYCIRSKLKMLGMHNSWTHYSTIKMFKTTKTTTCEIKRGTISGEWSYDGPFDALSFVSDKNIIFHGIGVFDCQGTITAKYKLFKGDNKNNDNNIIAQSKQQSFTKSSRTQIPIRFDLNAPINLTKNTKYTIQLEQKNSSKIKSHKTDSGKTTVTMNGVTITFSAAAESPNGTSTSSGAFPILYFAI